VARDWSRKAKSSTWSTRFFFCICTLWTSGLILSLISGQPCHPRRFASRSRRQDNRYDCSNQDCQAKQSPQWCVLTCLL
jgi:hypothetical protein